MRWAGPLSFQAEIPLLPAVEPKEGGRDSDERMDIDGILLAVAVMIAATVVASSVAKKLNLGSTVALLVVGMVLGPHSPRPLLTSHVEELQTIGEIGVMLLLFLVGLDTQPHKLSAMRRLFFGLGPAPCGSVDFETAEGSSPGDTVWTGCMVLFKGRRSPCTLSGLSVPITGLARMSGTV